jgi:hypothetical protein
MGMEKSMSGELKRVAIDMGGDELYRDEVVG